MRQLDTVAGIENYATLRSGLMDLDDDLARCPFCGHVAGYMKSERGGHDTDKFRIRVECSNTSCGVMTPRHYRSEDDARNAWNRRAV